MGLVLSQVPESWSDLVHSVVCCIESTVKIIRHKIHPVGVFEQPWQVKPLKIPVALYHKGKYSNGESQRRNVQKV